MNNAQDPRRPAFQFKTMLRKILPKGSSMPSELSAVMNNFEESLASRINKLKPCGNEDFLELSWMTSAVEQLSLIHRDVDNLSVALDHPLCDWKDKWVQTYLDESAKMLEILNAFISQIHTMEETHHYFVSALHHLRKGTPEALVNGRSSLSKWTELVGSIDPSLQRCSVVLDGLLQTPLYLPKTRHHKENVLMRAIYGLKMVTHFVCRVFAAILSGSAEKVGDIKAANEYLWADAFVDLQASVNAEIMRIRSGGNVIVLKELRIINEGVEKVYPILRDGVSCAEAESLLNSTSDFGVLADQFSHGIALLLKEVDRFFKALLSARSAMMGKAQRSLFPRGG